MHTLALVSERIGERRVSLLVHIDENDDIDDEFEVEVRNDSEVLYTEGCGEDENFALSVYNDIAKEEEKRRNKVKIKKPKKKKFKGKYTNYWNVDSIGDY